jgi:hypothetical protein
LATCRSADELELAAFSMHEAGRNLIAQVEARVEIARDKR